MSRGDTADIARAYAALSDEIFAEKEAEVRGLRTFKRDLGVLISSANAQVFYHLDVPLDFDTLQPHGCFIGSAAVVILSDQDSLRDAARNLVRFFRDESCGQCTPCRVGTIKALQLMQQPQWDTELLKELSQVMMDASICGLGQAAPNPVLSVIKHFPEATLSASVAE